MDILRQQLFNIIAFVFLGLFVAVWGSVLLRVGFWVPDGRTVAPPLNGALVTASGVLARRPSGPGAPGSSAAVNPSDVTAGCRGGSSQPSLSTSPWAWPSCCSGSPREPRPQT
jgi:hypothetical protein